MRAWSVERGGAGACNKRAARPPSTLSPRACVFSWRPLFAAAASFLKAPLAPRRRRLLAQYWRHLSEGALGGHLTPKERRAPPQRSTAVQTHTSRSTDPPRGRDTPSTLLPPLSPLSARRESSAPTARRPTRWRALACRCWRPERSVRLSARPSARRTCRLAPGPAPWQRVGSRERDAGARASAPRAHLRTGACPPRRRGTGCRTGRCIQPLVAARTGLAQAQAALYAEALPGFDGHTAAGAGVFQCGRSGAFGRT